MLWRQGTPLNMDGNGKYNCMGHSHRSVIKECPPPPQVDHIHRENATDGVFHQDGTHHHSSPVSPSVKLSLPDFQISVLEEMAQ
jgi:hypothetical protein